MQSAGKITEHSDIIQSSVGLGPKFHDTRSKFPSFATLKVRNDIVYSNTSNDSLSDLDEKEYLQDRVLLYRFLLLAHDELKCRSFFVLGLETAAFWTLHLAVKSLPVTPGKHEMQRPLSPW